MCEKQKQSAWWYLFATGIAMMLAGLAIIVFAAILEVKIAIIAGTIILVIGFGCMMCGAIRASDDMDYALKRRG